MGCHFSPRAKKGHIFRPVPKLLLHVQPMSMVFCYQTWTHKSRNTSLNDLFSKCGIRSHFLYCMFCFTRSWRRRRAILQQAQTFPPHDWLRSLTAVTQKRTCARWLDNCLSHAPVLVPPPTLWLVDLSLPVSVYAFHPVTPRLMSGLVTTFQSSSAFVRESF